MLIYIEPSYSEYPNTPNLVIMFLNVQPLIRNRSWSIVLDFSGDLRFTTFRIISPYGLGILHIYTILPYNLQWTTMCVSMGQPYEGWWKIVRLLMEWLKPPYSLSPHTLIRPCPTDSAPRSGEEGRTQKEKLLHIEKEVNQSFLTHKLRISLLQYFIFLNIYIQSAVAWDWIIFFSHGGLQS